MILIFMVTQVLKDLLMYTSSSRTVVSEILLLSNFVMLWKSHSLCHPVHVLSSQECD